MDAVAIIAVLCAVVMTLMVATRTQESTDTLRAPTRIENWHEYAESGHRIGPATAQVTIVEFGDYQCPVCRNTERELRELLAEYRGQIALVYRHWPLSYHPAAYPAARAAECAAAQDQFVEFHRLLFDNSEWMSDPTAHFMEFGRRVNISDMHEFSACLRLDTAVEAIERDIAAAKKVGGTGTPTFLVNNMLMSSGFNEAALCKEIDRILADR
jgi:protein-disulfide isomerase